MNVWRDTIVPTAMTIEEVVKTIDSSSMQIALVVDEEGRLAGTITDGDVRRGILKGVSLSDSVDRIMNPNPTILPEHTDNHIILSLMRIKQIRHIPLVDSNGRVTNLKFFDEL